MKTQSFSHWKKVLTLRNLECGLLCSFFVCARACFHSPPCQNLSYESQLYPNRRHKQACTNLVCLNRYARSCWSWSPLLVFVHPCSMIHVGTQAVLGGSEVNIVSRMIWNMELWKNVVWKWLRRSKAKTAQKRDSRTVELFELCHHCYVAFCWLAHWGQVLECDEKANQGWMAHSLHSFNVM